MAPIKMHDDEVDIVAMLVRRLIAVQCPQWAALPIAPVKSAGTDNAIYRLGDDLAVRLPRTINAAGRIAKEVHWLPKVSPHVPLDVPTPLALGKSGEGYPFPWAVYRWLDGETVTLDRIDDPIQAAVDLADFIAALQQIDPTDGPRPGEHNFGRGVPLADRDASTRAAIVAVQDMYDAEALTAAWETALEAPPLDGPPQWIHGDLQSGNLLAQGGRISAVIDFGGLGVGDPACDLQVAWNLFTDDARQVFREALHVDDAMWARGRGWALSVGLIALPYYQHTNPALAAIARHAIEQVLADLET